jgi:hypothetical protein
LFLAGIVWAQQKINSHYIHEEFRILKTTLEELHPDLYRYTSQEEFNAKADSILKSLPSDLDPVELYLRLSPLVTQIKNGHTGIRLPQRVCDTMEVLPLRLIAFEEKIYIYRNLSEEGHDLVGYQIISINGVPVEEIVRKSLEYVSVDGSNNNARFKAVVEDDLALYYRLIYGGSDEFKIELAGDASPLHRQRKLKSITYHEFLSQYDHGQEFPWILQYGHSATRRTMKEGKCISTKRFSDSSVLLRNGKQRI